MADEVAQYVVFEVNTESPDTLQLDERWRGEAKGRDAALEAASAVDVIAKHVDAGGSVQLIALAARFLEPSVIEVETRREVKIRKSTS